jgi:phospholipid/cholesterol/gamma-HCH transport system substrate-binding protein
VRKFRERNLFIVAAIAAAILIIAGVLALNIANFGVNTYKADLQTAVGLQAGDVVTIAGVRVGKVTGLSLAGTSARVTFTVSSSQKLGQDTQVNVKVLNPVGVEYLEVVPQGPGRLRGTIPPSHTTVPGTLVSDLNQFTTNTQHTNIQQLVKALKVLTETVGANSPAQTKAALDGVVELSGVLAGRQQELQNVVAQANQLTATLNGSSAQIVELLGQSNLLLGVLNQRKAALGQLLTTTTQLTTQLNHLIGADRSILDPMLNNLNTLSAFLAKDSSNIDEALPLLAAFSRYSANVTGSGPYADFVAPTLVIPDNLIAQCAAIGNLDPQRGCRV